MFRASNDLAVKREVKDYYTKLLSLFDELNEQTLQYDSTVESAKHLLKFYETIRDNDIYQHIKILIITGEKCSQAEYLFYALVTDNVSQLNPNRLSQRGQIDIQVTVPTNVNFHDPINAFAQNLDDLAAALRFQNTPTRETFLAFQERLSNRLDGMSTHLNLSGIRIREIPEMDPDEQTWLSFSRCLFVNTTFEGNEYSIDVYDSIFSKTDLSVTILYASEFKKCHFSDLSFCGEIIDKVSFKNCDLSSVSFFADNINYISFDYCRLNQVKLGSLQLTQPWFYQCSIENSCLSFDETNILYSEGYECNVGIKSCNVSDSELNFGNIVSAQIVNEFMIDHCKIYQSQIRFGNLDSVKILWRYSTITKTSISTQSMYNAKHVDFDIKFHRADLREAQFTLESLVSFHRFSKKYEEVIDNTLAFPETSFSDPESFNEFLSQLNKDISEWLIDPSIMYSFQYPDRKLSNLATLVKNHIIHYHRDTRELCAEIIQAALNHALFSHRNTGGFSGYAGYLFGSCSVAAPARKILSDALQTVNAPYDVEDLSPTYNH